MRFQDIVGQEKIKQKLVSSAIKGRIGHAQLFVAEEGRGGLPLAIAYAQFLNCENPESSDSCNQCPSCKQYLKLAHPDLIFVFPTVSDSGKKKEALSDAYLKEWREFVSEQPYGSLTNWMDTLEVGNKQARILKKESEEIVKKLSLKPFGTGFRVLIIWHPELMNADAANKLLKVIEEPPERTIFLLVSQDSEQLLATIVSRTQSIRLAPLSTEEIATGLIATGEDATTAHEIALLAQGNYHRALLAANHHNQADSHQGAFVSWIRACFKADLQALVPWSDQMAKIGREKQKQFLQFAGNMFRQALMENYRVHDLVTSNKEFKDFSLIKFAPFVNSANVIRIVEELGTAEYHIERNANAKIVLLDLSIQMSRLLRAKEQKE